MINTSSFFKYTNCKKSKYNIDISVVGKSLVGKSLLIKRIMEEEYKKYTTTLGLDIRVATFNYLNIPITLIFKEYSISSFKMYQDRSTLSEIKNIDTQIELNSTFRKSNIIHHQNEINSKINLNKNRIIEKPKNTNENSHIINLASSINENIWNLDYSSKLIIYVLTLDDYFKITSNIMCSDEGFKTLFGILDECETTSKMENKNKKINNNDNNNSDYDYNENFIYEEIPNEFINSKNKITEMTKEHKTGKINKENNEEILKNEINKHNENNYNDLSGNNYFNIDIEIKDDYFLNTDNNENHDFIKDHNNKNDNSKNKINLIYVLIENVFEEDNLKRIKIIRDKLKDQTNEDCVKIINSFNIKNEDILSGNKTRLYELNLNNSDLMNSFIEHLFKN